MKLIDNPVHGDTIDASDGMYPCSLTALRTGAEVGTKHGTVYGFVQSGTARIIAGALDVTLTTGGFFAFPGIGKVIPKDNGLVAAIVRHGFRGQFAAGQREARGRLSYIDGCSDSLLVYPPRLGDPCLNHLHFPPGILQTQHTHPSVRLGIVADGEGEAWQQETTTNGGWVKPLKPGAIFLLEEQELHSFRTRERSMDVIAFHPDSDWGPTDAGHPMIQRTYIDHGK